MKPVIPKVALSTIKHLFMLAVMDVETNNGLAKQLAIKELERQLLGTISTNTYSFFEIIVLPRNSEDVQNALLIVTVKNFEFYKEGSDPRHFRIVIHPSWQKFDVYQASIDGKEFVRV